MWHKAIARPARLSEDLDPLIIRIDDLGAFFDEVDEHDKDNYVCQPLDPTLSSSPHAHDRTPQLW